MSPLLEKLSVASAALLVVDVQEKLLPAMDGAQAVVGNVRKMLEAAGILGLRIIITEQYPAGLGRTCAALGGLLGQAPPIEKLRFSACIEPVMQRLESQGVRQVIIVGIEAHVCVQQTVLDLLRAGIRPLVCVDAISSRRALDREVAVERMRQAGAILTTTESVIFELLGEAGSELFRRILRIVR